MMINPAINPVFIPVFFILFSLIIFVFYGFIYSFKKFKKNNNIEKLKKTGIKKRVFLKKSENIPAKAKRFLKNIDVQFISIVKRGANGKQIILKGDPEGDYGYRKEIDIRKFDDEEQIIYGIVYAPDQVDSQGDYTDEIEIKKMAYNFMKNQRIKNIDTDHDFVRKDVYVAESWIVKHGDKLFKNDVGAWAVGLKVEDKALWDQIKKDGYTGLSLAGEADAVLLEKSGSTESKSNGGYNMNIVKLLKDILDKNQETSEKLKEIEKLIKDYEASGTKTDENDKIISDLKKMLDLKKKKDASKNENDDKDNEKKDGKDEITGIDEIKKAAELIKTIGEALGIVEVVKGKNDAQTGLYSFFVKKSIDNRDIIEKADMVLADLSNGGLLDPVRANKFIDIVQEKTVLKKYAKFKRFKGDSAKFDKIGFGSRILRPAVENKALAEGDRSSPTTGQVELTTKEFIGEIRLPYGALENNIEGKNLYNHIIKLIAEKVAIDLEELWINGDTASSDPYLATIDGFLKQATSHVVDASGNQISKELFKQLIKALPKKYIRDKNRVKILTHDDIEFNWRDILSNRGTAAGDGYLLNANESRVFGHKILPVPLIATYNFNDGTDDHECSSALFTPGENMIIGISRNLTMEYDKDITTRQFIIVVTIKTNVTYQESDAVAKMINIEI